MKFLLDVVHVEIYISCNFHNVTWITYCVIAYVGGNRLLAVTAYSLVLKHTGVFLIIACAQIIFKEKGSPPHFFTACAIFNFHCFLQTCAIIAWAPAKILHGMQIWSRIFCSHLSFIICDHWLIKYLFDDYRLVTCVTLNLNSYYKHSYIARACNKHTSKQLSYYITLKF